MTTDTLERIRGYIRKNKQAKAVDLVRDIGITNAAIHRQLNKLLAQGEISKVGKPPTVFYILKAKAQPLPQRIPSDVSAFINATYVYVSPAGEFLEGIEGFTRWVRAIKQEKYLLPLAQEYVIVRSAATTFFTSDGWIDATESKERETFGETSVQKLLFRDFYSVEKFGKTRLGQMVLYAKTSQNIAIIDSIVTQIKPVIDRIIQVHNIDTVGFIPPSIKRKVQLMTELRNRLHIHLPEVAFVKAYTGDVTVSQKSLSKLAERIENARQTIFVDMNKSAQQSNNVLLFDDAVGSGATMHETAKKVRALLKPTGNIIGFAIIGSSKGFEVIREI
jgi:hypothetical protein